MLNNVGLGGLAVIAVVVVVLFGRGRISSLMGEVGSGISSFRSAVRGSTRSADEAAGHESQSKSDG